jgi:hypothetical protein
VEVWPVNCSGESTRGGSVVDRRERSTSDSKSVVDRGGKSTANGVGRLVVLAFVISRIRKYERICSSGLEEQSQELQ